MYISFIINYVYMQIYIWMCKQYMFKFIWGVFSYVSKVVQVNYKTSVILSSGSFFILIYLLSILIIGFDMS